MELHLHIKDTRKIQRLRIHSLQMEGRLMIPEPDWWIKVILVATITVTIVILIT